MEVLPSFHGCLRVNPTKSGSTEIERHWIGNGRDGVKRRKSLTMSRVAKA
jgi:hypothetical protein